MDPLLEESAQDLLKCGETASIFFQKPLPGLDPTRFEEFWKKLRAASYASTLIIKLTSMYTGEDKHVQLYDRVKALVSNSLGPVPEVPRVENDLNSILYLQRALFLKKFLLLFDFVLFSSVNHVRNGGCGLQLRAQILFP